MTYYREHKITALKEAVKIDLNVKEKLKTNKKTTTYYSTQLAEQNKILAKDRRLLKKTELLLVDNAEITKNILEDILNIFFSFCYESKLVGDYKPKRVLNMAGWDLTVLLHTVGKLRDKPMLVSPNP